MFIVLAVYRPCGPKNLQAFESKQKLWNFEMIFHFKSSKISILKTVCFFFQKTDFHYDIYIKLEFSIITFWNLKNEFPHMYYFFQSLNVSFALCDSRRMAVGFHPLVVCEENKEQVKAKQFYEPLHHIFVKFGVVSIWSLYLMFLCSSLRSNVLNFCICIILNVMA